MYKVGDVVVYKRDVCRINEIKEKYFKNTDYYVMSLIDDDSLVINIPVDNSDIRNVISKKGALELINKMPDIKIIDIQDKNIENEYKSLLYTQKIEDLVSIIKSSYLRNNERVANNKKVSEKDENYFNKAEKFLYNELSVSLNMSYDETKEYIINLLKK